MNKSRLISTSDWHISLKPPVARSKEPNWLKTQAGYLKQLKSLSEENNDAPIIVAGDLLDRWDNSAELTNFLIAFMPHVYAIPGNHDLPAHRYDDINKSTFWTLVEAGKITIIRPNEPVEIDNHGDPIRLHGFPCGYEVKPLEKPHDLILEVAVVHDLIWTEKTSFLNAPKNKRLRTYEDKVKGYDVAVFGDNHTCFQSKLGNCSVVNCGTLMRRKVSEISYEPSAWLIYNDGSVERKKLDCSKDMFIDYGSGIREMSDGELTFNAGEFVEELMSLSDTAIDFGEALRRAAMGESVPTETRAVILEMLEKSK